MTRRVDKPWGWELVWAETDDYVGKILHIEAGHRLSLQLHRVKDESLYVVSGELDLVLEDEGGALPVRRMGVGDVVRILPGRRHRMTAVTTCDVMEVSTPELDDVVRLSDDYGRSGDDG